MSRGLIDRVLAAVTDKLSNTGWQTLNSDIRYRKKNGFVIVNGSSGSTVVSSSTLVGTLPTGFRPDIDLDNAGSAMGGTADILVRIQANGYIRLWAQPSTNYWSFTFVFPISGGGS